jgi:hypothetical protein
VDANLEAIARGSFATPHTQNCKWDPVTKDFTSACVFAGGPRGTIGLPCGPSGIDSVGADCQRPPRMPRSWEHTVGAQRDLGWGLRLGADLVYRRTIGLPVAAETNGIWNASGTAITGYRDGRNHTITDFSTDATLHHRYLGATALLRKEAGALRLLVAYTWSRHDGNAPVFDGSPWRTNLGTNLAYPDGPLRDERRHSFRAMANYDLRSTVSFGAIFTTESGRPLPRLVYRTASGSYEDRRAAPGYNPGINLNDPADDGPDHDPATSRLNLQVRVRAKRLTGIDLNVYVDVINVFDWGAGRYRDLQTLAPVQDPKSFRVGIEYRY